MDNHHDGEEPWASRMYLIPESDYDLLIKEKHKEERRQEQEQISYPQAPTPSQETPAPSHETSHPPHPQETKIPQEERGEGKKYSELDIKKFNRDFLTKQNIERFLENQKWGKIFERIKPFLENNTDKKTPIVTFGEDRDLLVPAQKPLSKSEEFLRRNVTIQPMLQPTLTHTAQLAENRRDQLKAKEAIEARAREAVEATARKDKEREKAFQISPIPPSEHRARQADYVKQLFQSPEKISRQPPVDQGASPFPPADSTRAKKKKRKNSLTPHTDDDDDDPDVDGAKAGPSSGRGFKKFKKWEKF